MEDRARDLVKRLSAEGFQSPYLERLRAKTAEARRSAELGKIQREIVEEMAASLGRAEDRINRALLELDVLAARMRKADEEGKALLIDDFNRMREYAKLRVRDLRIQREALGFRNNALLVELYPIPPAIKR
ncbi:MAG: hypothetical protein H6718_23230 [Polyangiaceae bacterium]|nr:hypothetical protein [Myxococcales bacterium]MCB9588340.1 hypothetical protein [Polyangiaceae bacterium]